MSGVNKRIVKTSQRPRKKPSAHLSKPSAAPGSSSEVGFFSSPHLAYQLVRCFMGSVGEVSTHTHKSIGVIKAVAPDGGFGMTFVRSTSTGSDDGPFSLENDKVIPLSDIEKIIVRNVKTVEVQKDEPAVNEVPQQLDDPETCLQHYFTSNDYAEAFSLTSDEHFSPEAMFEVNKQKYNVTSSYHENLEGYTVPLDKTDPEFKAKEEYYAKVAKEIESNKCIASTWESLGDDEVEDEELRFSAVFQDGVRGRELKNTFTRSGKRGGRGTNRTSLPQEHSNTHKHTGTKSHKSNTSTPFPDHNKSPTDSSASRTSSDAVLEYGSPKPASHVSPAPMDFPTSIGPSPDKNAPKSAESTGKKEEKKKGILDPDAPEFKPSGLIIPLEPAGLSGPTFNPIGYSQSMPLSVSGFAVSNQHPFPNGGASSAPFTLPSSVSCVLPSTMAPQFAALRNSQIGFSPQQFAMVSQQLSASGSLPNQSSIGQSAAGPRGPRQSVPAGNYPKQRPIDQANSVSQQLPFSIFSPQGFSFVQAASYPIGVPLISTVAGGFHPSAYPGMPTLAGAVSAPQGPGQQSSGTQHSAQPSTGQVNHIQPGSQAITSPSQGQGTQFHAGYNPQLGSVQGPTGVAPYSQYSTGQIIGSQTPSGPLGYYSQPVYQTSGLISFPIQQVGVGNQPPIGSQLHSQGQQSLIPPQPLQLQAAQQQSTVQSVQQQPHLFFAAGPYQLSPQQMLAQAMTMGVSPQGVQNTFNIPQNVHPQSHPVQLYMPQQPSSTG